ncbi:MAG: NifU family protein [Elusimicrobia bacterium]|jgi:Fe-S cluster biogenesis protein NfuA|nr:NifU family protein [Elusimicrobiota bacterium]
MKEKVEAVLNQVRPALIADGGNVELVDITPDNIVKVKLQGHCGNCPMAMMTLEMGIKKAIQEALPEIKDVVAV